MFSADRVERYEGYDVIQTPTPVATCMFSRWPFIQSSDIYPHFIFFVFTLTSTCNRADDESNKSIIKFALIPCQIKLSFKLKEPILRYLGTLYQLFILIFLFSFSSSVLRWKLLLTHLLHLFLCDYTQRKSVLLCITTSKQLTTSFPRTPPNIYFYNSESLIKNKLFSFHMISTKFKSFVKSY